MKPRPPSSDLDSNPIPLATPPPVSRGLRECTACMRPIPADARVCVFCGHNPDDPMASSEGAKCRHCGYDLTGLKSARCPECGKLLTPRRRFAPSREDISREVARHEYMKPFLMIITCLPLLMLVDVLRYNPAAAVAALIGVAVLIPVATLVFLGCCLLWIGFDAPLHLTVLRIAGILSAVVLTSELASFIPIMFVPTAITVLVYVGLLSEMLDMDFTDAAIVAILTYFAGIVAAIGIVIAMR